MKVYLILCLLWVLPFAGYSQLQVHQIDSLMQTAYQRGIFNGNILIAEKGKIIYQKSLGFAEGSKKTPLGLQMKFDIGSISKEFNGVAIMLLKEKGKLSLDDPLQKYFPEFPSWASQVKLRHLINYTSGIPVLGPNADGNDSLIYHSLTGLNALTASPGTVYIYNHINVSLQRRIIEKVSGIGYARFVERYLFKPAGMKQSAVDYPVNAKGMAMAFDNEGNYTPYAQATKGWVRLPVGDLYKWILALHTNKIIGAASLKELGENFPGGESSLGTAVFQENQLIWHQHQGSNSNYEAAYYAHLADGITIVMMTSNQQMKVWPLKTAILDILKGQPFTIPKKSLYLSVRDKFLANVNTGMEYYLSLKSDYQDQYDFSFEIGDLISTGKYLQRRKKLDDAILVLQAAVKLDFKPEDVSYGYELIGECFQAKDDREEAIANYRTALKVFPGNKNAAGMIQQLTAH